MKHICTVFRKNGTPVDTSCVVAFVFPIFCGSKPLISSRLLRQAETSIPSFCLIHKWAPLLLQYEVMPQGIILTRLTGSKILIQFTFFYSASLQMDVCLNRILLFVKRLLPAPDGGYPHGTVCCCNPSHVTEAHRRCELAYSPR